MKTIRIKDTTHAELVKVAGELQALNGKAKTLDDAVKSLIELKAIFSDHEVGLELQHIFHREIPKQQAFLWFWGLASLAKLLRDHYGFDSPLSYVCAFAAKRFFDQLESLGSHALNGSLIEYFKKDADTPHEIIRFLERCADDGYGNWVRMGHVSKEDVSFYLECLVCFEDGKWEKRCLESVRKKRA